MAQRRMIDKDLVTTQVFMDLTATAQVLYFRLCAFADDEGFVGNPTMLKATPKALKILEENGYIFRFKSGVVLIRHFNVHNKIRKDTFKETIHKAEKALVLLNSDKIYEYVSVTEPLRSRTDPVPQESIGKGNVIKDSPAKDREAKKNIIKDNIIEQSIDKGKEEKPVTTEACGAPIPAIDKENNFFVFWDKYPNKHDQLRAKLVFMAIDEDFDVIMEGLEYNKKSNQWVTDNGIFIPKAHNWLKRRGWNDRPPLYIPKTTTASAVGGGENAAPHGDRNRLGPAELEAIRRAVQQAEEMS